MKLLVKPSDLIKRFIWDQYEHFCLHDISNGEIEKIIKEDKEFEISEPDAFVVGLTNVIYSDKVIYKYKIYLKDLLENKSFDAGNPTTETNDDGEEETFHKVKMMINKELVINHAKLFFNKLPKTWDSSKESNMFNRETAQIPDLSKKLCTIIEKLPTTMIQGWPCVKYISVKKAINKVVK